MVEWLDKCGKCKGVVTATEYESPRLGRMLYKRRCARCHREEKSMDGKTWVSPAKFLELFESELNRRKK